MCLITLNGCSPDVYAASDAGYYRQCWQELSDIRILFDDP